MLIQHLNELSDCNLVEKLKYDRYPLKVTYFLTPRGKKIFEAITIMQKIGIEIMLEDNKKDLLKEKGLI